MQWICGGGIQIGGLAPRHRTCAKGGFYKSGKKFVESLEKGNRSVIVHMCGITFFVDGDDICEGKALRVRIGVKDIVEDY